MADNPIPFTTGALRDWPLIEEIIDDALENIARQAGREDIDESYRAEVLKSVRRSYEAMNGSISLTFSLPALPVDPATAAEIEASIAKHVGTLTKWFHDRTSAALGERILAAVEIVELRRTLRLLGHEPPERP
jgi:hypothetical protein